MSKLIQTMQLFALLPLLLFSCNQQLEEQAETLVETPAPEVPLRDFFKNPETFRYRLSPDGNFISYLAPYKDRLNIHIKQVGEETATRITADTARDIGLYFWANNNQLLYIQDTGGDENFQLFVADRSGENVKSLTPFEGVRTEIIDDLENIEDEVIIGLNRRNPQVFDPYRLTLSTGKMELLYENPGNITDWGTDHEGKLRLANVTDGVNNTILYRDDENGNFQEVVTTNYKETLQPLFFTFDNKNVYALSNLGRDKIAIVEYDIANGKELKEVYANDENDIDNLSYSNKRKVITQANYVSWKGEKHFFDQQTQEMYQQLEEQLGDYEIDVLASTKEEDKFVLVTGSDRARTKYYVYDQPNNKLEKIADTYPWIKEEEMAEMKPIQYTARDGLIINGYLTLPVGMEATNLPVVVNPHGGPWARDVWGYNSEVQFLANRGYAVLQMNFRGSTGYGRAFWEASFKQWGQTMQNDITDGVKWLVEEGIADPERVGIYGGSYGGYATLAGITLTPGLYACAVDYVGVSNMFTFMNTIPPYWEPFRDMFYEMVGNPGNPEDSLMLAKASPVFHVDSIRVPLLIAQGANDPRVNKDESDQMVAALKERGIEVEYIVKDNEGHGFANEENRFEFYEAMERFFDKHLKNKTKVAT
ncbi:MAG: S9 family peptidase [Cyclobacteriaceae bacterium]